MDRIIKSYNDIDITSEQYGELLSPRDWITAIVDILCKIKGEPQFYYDNLLSIKEIIGVKEDEPIPDYFKNLVELSKSITDFDLFKERAEEELKSMLERLSSVEDTVDNLSDRLQISELDIIHLKEEVEDIKSRLDGIDSSLEIINSDIESIKNTLLEHEDILEKLQEDVSNIFLTLRDHSSRLDSLETNLENLTQTVNNIDLRPQSLGCVIAGDNAVKLLARSYPPDTSKNDGEPNGTIWLVFT